MKRTLETNCSNTNCSHVFKPTVLIYGVGCFSRCPKCGEFTTQKMDPNSFLSAEQEPRVNPEEAASQGETSSELSSHEVQPRLGFEKGVAP